MPRLPRNINVVIIEKRNSRTHVTEDLRVRRAFVAFWLRWLKNRSNVYKHIRISEENLSQLPENDVPNDLPTITNDEFEEVNTEVRDCRNVAEEVASDANDEPVVVEEPFNDVDQNPAVDTGVYYPPNNLPIEVTAIRTAINNMQGIKKNIYFLSLICFFLR